MNPQSQDVTTTTAEHSSEQLTTAAASRRKFLVRASAASLPVIASVQSGSAWGCVNLQCTSAPAALSTSGSAVASAVANNSNYPARPDWKDVGIIKKVISKDFDSWLTLDFAQRDNFNYKNARGKFVSCSTLTTELMWANKAKNFDFYEKNSTTPYVRSYSIRTSGVRVAAVYKGVVVKTGTNLSTLFDNAMSGTLSTTAIDTHKYRFVIAALLGSIWERHPEYTLYYGILPKCYPEPDQIVNKFKSLTTVQKADMNRLFEYYFEGTVNGNIIG